jgi:GntR family transcriptional regulator, galactonate operon transcriptional repressor
MGALVSEDIRAAAATPGADGAPASPAAVELAAGPTPLRSTSDRLGTTVVTALADDIVAGRIPPGGTLPTEPELGGRFGVSRTVVRESVQLLQDKGLVLIRRGIGTVVCSQDKWDVIDDVVLEALVRNDATLTVLDQLVAVRASLERDLAASAAMHRSPEQAAALEQAFAEMQRQVDDMTAFAAADVAFHDVVMDASGNRLGRAIVSSIHGKARMTGRYVGSTSTELAELTLQEHGAILRAIIDRDAAAASAAMQAHIVGSWSRRRPARPGSAPA